MRNNIVNVPAPTLAEYIYSFSIQHNESTKTYLVESELKGRRKLKTKSVHIMCCLFMQILDNTVVTTLFPTCVVLFICLILLRSSCLQQFFFFFFFFLMWCRSLQLIERTNRRQKDDLNQA